MEPPAMPTILHGRLEFGNREQINALREYEAAIAEYEEFNEDVRKGTLVEYDVELTYEATIRTKVFAKSKRQAEQIARDEADQEEFDDVEFTGAYVYGPAANNKKENAA